LFDATMLVMGGIIGVGIFFNPHDAGRLVPEVGPFLALWVVGGLLALSGAMTFAELGATFPKAGGWFIYLFEAFGGLIAFLFAWVVLFVVSTGACAVIADFSAAQFALLLYGPEQAPEGFGTVLGTVMILLISGLAAAGVKRAALFQDVCMLLKLIALGAFVFAGLVFFSPTDGAATAPALEAAPPIGEGLVRAILPVLFSYGGWQLVTYIANSVEEPERNIPRSILLGVGGVLLVYLLVNWSFVRVLGVEGIASTRGFAAEMARLSLGSSGEKVLIAAMAVSSLGVCTAILMATPGLYVAMSRQRLFLHTFGRVHPRTGAPLAAIGVQCVVTLTYFIQFRDAASKLSDAVVFTEWVFHCLTGVALLSLRRRCPELPRPFKSPLYPLFPLAYAVLAGMVVVATLIGNDWSTTRVGLIVLAIGAIVYPGWSRAMRRSHPA